MYFECKDDQGSPMEQLSIINDRNKTLSPLWVIITEISTGGFRLYLIPMSTAAKVTGNNAQRACAALIGN